MGGRIRQGMRRIWSITRSAPSIVVLVALLLGLTPATLVDSTPYAFARDGQPPASIPNVASLNSVAESAATPSEVSTARTDAPILDPAEHYVIFLGGIGSSSGSGEPIRGLFTFARDRLAHDLQISRFIYFSYRAAAAHGAGGRYCTGWTGGCGSSKPAEVLFATPAYAAEDTHLSIDDQALALDWLIAEIVRSDAAAQIDLIGYSLGGVIAARWAVTRGGARDFGEHVRAIILLESPVGGIPVGNLIAGPLCDRLEFCPPLKSSVEGKFGAVVLRQLQTPSDERSRSESVVPSLSETGRLFRVTSIQSTADYLVNGGTLEFCFDALCESRGSFLAGTGSQSWGADRQTLNFQYLGGETSPLRPRDLPDLVQRLVSRVSINHGLPIQAPASQVQMATWIVQALGGGAAR